MSEPLTEKIVKQKYSAEWRRFSRWACRRLIEKTHRLVYEPLGLKFHVYYGEGRPFDADGCDWISSWGVSQNVAGQVKSVGGEYETMTRGLEMDPNATFLGMLQAEIQAVARRRPFHWQELRNNIIKRAISTRGGAVLYTEVEPQCPGLHYSVAAACRFIAQWEDYFVGSEPAFAGDGLDSIVKIDPAPADLVLLRRGGKGLLILFGDEPAGQPEPLTLTLTFASGKTEQVQLPPMGMVALEIDL